MDRLVKPDLQELNLSFIRDQKCSATFKLTNLMHTMSVAVSLTTTNQPLFSFSQPFAIIQPLSTSSFTLQLSQPCNLPPLSTPLDAVLVRSSMLPTGKAHIDDLRRLFSKPGPHIFKDATIPVSFVGPHVVEFLLSPSPKTLETTFLLSKAISCCNQSELNNLLRCAASSGKSYFVATLVEAGADVNYRDRSVEDSSVMSLAVKSGNLEVVEVLIDSGFGIDNLADRFLHEAASMDRVDLMEILCLGYVDIDLNSVDSQGQTAVHVAAKQGNVEALQFLISVGSDPELVDANGWTPLHFAASEGRIEAVEVLLNHSTFAKYAVTKEGKTAFALAVEKGHKDMYDALHLGDMLHRAARIDDVHAMKTCLAEGANVNGRDQNGWTPLHRAAFKGRMESVKLLVSHGAQVDAVDDDGYTPLHRAVEAGHAQVALYLVAHGARANMKGLKGLLPSVWDSLEKPHNPTTDHVNSFCPLKERA